MKQAATAPILVELGSPSSLDAQAAALRALKNDVIGHQQRKENWIRQGVVAPLTRILDQQRDSNPQSVRTEAIIIVGSLAQGGPQFVPPLAASQIIIPLASLLNPSISSSTAILAALRTLNTIADSAALEQRPSNERGDWALQPLYTEQNLSHIANILNQDSSVLVAQQQIALAAALVSKTCQKESCREQLARAGVLDALARRAASFVVLVAEQEHQDLRRPGGTPKFDIPTAPPRARLAPILQAIGAIVTNSSHRVEQFLHARAFGSVFHYWGRDGWRTTPKKPASPVNHSYAELGALPPLHHSSPSQPTSFPPFGELARWGKTRPGREPTARGTIVPEDDETPVAGWLAHVIQTEQGVTRLMAAWLLTIVFREGHTNKAREKVLSMQLVPMLVRMLEADYTPMPELAPSYDNSVIQPPRWLIKQFAPQVLGLLISENELLQRAASEAGALKKLSQMLKHTFDPLPQSEVLPLWNPDGTPDQGLTTDPSANIRQLGPPGLAPLAYHVLHTRAAVMGAIAAMATRSDDHRKTIITSGVVPYLIASLKPLSSLAEPASKLERATIDTTENPTFVLMQACAAATALSRSVSNLRTSLIDAGLAKPVFDLLQHADIQVQIAATGAVCNIVLEFSPARQDIVNEGVLTTLCRHAHSTNVQLRLNSLWALKHLVHSANNPLKMSCVEGLGSSWLKQIISNDADGPAPLAMGTSNAAGEQVDLLNAVGSSAGNALRFADYVDPLSRSEARVSDRAGFSEKEPDVDDDDDANRNDVLVQEQGLDLIRNLIAGDGSAEMIDYVFRQLGQDELFAIFTHLLHPSSGMAFPKYPEIVLSVVFILVHLATGAPRHRQLLLAQHELMRLFVPLAQHPNHQVRMAYAWFVINLTWVEDSADRQGARARAYELRKLGLEQRLETLQRDADLDVRERAKQASATLGDLLKGGM